MTMVSMLVVSSFPIRKAREDLMMPYGRKFVVALVLAPLFHTLTALAAAIWQHAAAATAAPLVSYMSSGAVETAVGPAATALAWLVFGLSLATAIMSMRAANIMHYRWAEDNIPQDPLYSI